jgi:hypothetical protein
MKLNDPIYKKKVLAETLSYNFYLLILISWRKTPENSCSFRYYNTSCNKAAAAAEFNLVVVCIVILYLWGDRRCA